ncbi:hypothetical protein ACOSQ4_010882 [Xanthoceras sorbifolium]
MSNNEVGDEVRRQATKILVIETVGQVHSGEDYSARASHCCSRKENFNSLINEIYLVNNEAMVVEQMKVHEKSGRKNQIGHEGLMGSSMSGDGPVYDPARLAVNPRPIPIKAYGWTYTTPIAPPYHSALLGVACWIAPPGDKLKINTDASLNLYDGVIGLGIVIRVSKDVVLASSVQWIASPFSTPLVEAFGMLRGLIFARDLGLLPAVLELDALVVVNVADSSHSLADLEHYVFYIQNILALFPGFSIGFVLREAN